MGNDLAALDCAKALLKQGNLLAALITNQRSLIDFAKSQNVNVYNDLNAHLRDIINTHFDFLFSFDCKERLSTDFIKLCSGTWINCHYGPLPSLAGFHSCYWAIAQDRPHHQITWHTKGCHNKQDHP